jgi:2-polyprenyl-6-methoxyphenol hydroxylase-like FAD-dependent oxidoreductase
LAAGVVAISDAASIAPVYCGMEYLGNGARAGLMPLPGGRSYWWFMHDQPDRLATISIEQVGQRTRSWPGELRHAVSHTRPDNSHAIAVLARDPPARLGRGNIICIGDAGHAMDPNLGQGACQALEDAAVLGDLAANLKPEQILPAFELARLARIRMIMERSVFWSHAAHGSVWVQKLVRGLVRLTPPGMLNRSMEAVHRMPAGSEPGRWSWSARVDS